RAYGIAQLRSAGADAVPFLLDALRDPSLAEHRTTILLAMEYLDQAAVPPLLAALASEDTGLVLDVLKVLGTLGDRDAVPRLRYLAEAPHIAPAIQAAARSAVQKILGAPYGDLPPVVEELVAQADRYYEHRVNLRATSDNRVRLWRWVPREGLKDELVSTSY